MTRSVFLLTGLALVMMASAAPARAAVAPSRGRIVTERDQNLRRVRRLLQEKEVCRRLMAIGVRRQEIERRLDHMNDAELQSLADRLDSLAVGRGALGVVIAVLVIAALVLLVIWLAERV